MSDTTGGLWFEVSNQSTGSQLGAGAQFRRQYLRPTVEFTVDAYLRLAEIADRGRASIAQDMLFRLESAAQGRTDLTVFPVYVIESDISEAIFIEWILPMCRVGITVELEPEESGWYFIHQDPSGVLESQYGDIGSFNAARIIDQIPHQTA